MNYDYKILEEKFKALPEDIQLVMSSTDTSRTILEIAQKHDLFIDQADILSDEVSYVLLGLTRSKDFVRTISKDLEIDEKRAIEVAQDINKEIFDKMRKSLQEIENRNDQELKKEESEESSMLNNHMSGEKNNDSENEQHASMIKEVEKAGGFSIDQPETSPASNRSVTASTYMPSSATNRGPRVESSIAPDHMLEDVPGTAAQEISSVSTTISSSTAVSSANTPSSAAPAKMPSIVDTLLAKGVAIEATPPTGSIMKNETKSKPYDGIDPYREPVE
jgi:hypothetical protein